MLSSRSVAQRGALLRTPSARPARALSRATTQPRASSLAELSNAIDEIRNRPPSEREAEAKEAAKSALATLSALKETGELSLFASGRANRRQILLGELRQIGCKAPELIGVPSTRNDLVSSRGWRASRLLSPFLPVQAFLVTTVGVSSVLAVVLGQLPGDWGFFGAYLSGGISIVVLAVGSVAPGLLQIPIEAFSGLFPDYRERVLRHEAAHFLIGYLYGVPVVEYSLGIGKEHTDFIVSYLQRPLYGVGAKGLSDVELDQLAVVSMAGVASEALRFDEIVGQTTDLFDLQKLIDRSATKLSSAQQQSVTRWAVWAACGELKKHEAQYVALQEAMSRNASVVDCIRAIEGAAKPA